MSNIDELMEKAGQADPQAQFKLGEYYYNAEGVKQDFFRAFKWFTLAAEQDHLDAQFYLGICYFYGKGVKQDYKEAIKWFTKPALQGDVRAQYNLGVCYFNDDSVEQDYIKAAKWFKKAALQGDVRAQVILAEFYFCGEGVKQDYKEAIKWFAAASNHSYEAQRMLGFCYEYGTGVEQNYEKAKYWYKKTAECGDAIGQWDLARLYLKLKNKKQAMFWYIKAADQGDTFAQTDLINNFYWKAKFKDYKELISSPSQFVPEWDYSFFMGCYNYIKRNFTQAIHYFSDFSLRNDKDANYFLGKIFFYCFAEYPKAKKYLLFAAKLGSEEAIELLNGIKNKYKIKI